MAGRAGDDWAATRSASGSRGSFLMVAPVAALLAGGNGDLPTGAAVVPALEKNFASAWQESPFARWMINSAMVVVTGVITNLILCNIAGYAFARNRFAGSRILFVIILGTLMVAEPGDALRDTCCGSPPPPSRRVGGSRHHRCCRSLPGAHQDSAAAHGAAAVHGRDPDVPVRLERLPPAAGGHLLTADLDGPTGPGQLPERPLHRLAGPDGRHPDESIAGATAVPGRPTPFRLLDRHHRDQMAEGRSRWRNTFVRSGWARRPDLPCRLCRPSRPSSGSRAATHWRWSRRPDRRAG